MLTIQRHISHVDEGNSFEGMLTSSRLYFWNQICMGLREFLGQAVTVTSLQLRNALKSCDDLSFVVLAVKCFSPSKVARTVVIYDR